MACLPYNLLFSNQYFFVSNFLLYVFLVLLLFCLFTLLFIFFANAFDLQANINYIEELTFVNDDFLYYSYAFPQITQFNRGGEIMPV